jgi:uncharacterized protein involved in exopolysaccharide biosynthesis
MKGKPMATKELVDYAIEFLRYRRTLIFSFVLFFLLGYLIAFLMPKYYRAEVVILPPQPELKTGFSEMALPLSGFIGLNFFDQETNRYLAILNSRTLREALIKKMNLMEVYDVKYLDEALEQLNENTEIEIDNEGTIRIKVLDRQPQRAAKLANLYVRYLDSLYTKIVVEKARFDRIYLARQLQKTKAELDSIENTMKRFQEIYGIISLPEQIEATLKAYADLLGQKIAQEIQLQVMSKSRQPTHPDIVALKSSIQAIQERLNTINQAERATESILLPLENLPALSKQYADLYREVETRNKVYAILLAEYERAKIEEAKTTPRVQILDPAVPPRKRAKPKRILTAAVVATSSTLILSLFLLLSVHLQFIREINPERHRKLTVLLDRLILPSGIFKKKRGS